MTRFSLGCFAAEDALAAITEPARIAALPFDDQTARAILKELREPNPYYLQLACHLVWEQARSEMGEAPESLHLPEDRVREVLSKGQARIFGRFTPAQQEVLKILAQSHPVPLTVRQMEHRLEGLGAADRVGDLDPVVATLTQNEQRPIRYLEGMAAYRINHDLFAAYIMENECAPGTFDVGVLQALLEYAPRLFRVAEFVMDEKMLVRLWTFRQRLQFSEDAFRIIARSILHLNDEQRDVQFQWFTAFKGNFAGALSELAEAPEVSIRRSAMDAIGCTEDIRCLNALVAGLSDKDKAVRRAALEALGELQNEAAVPILIRALDDSDVRYRQLAAEALGKVKSMHALSALRRKLLEDDSGSVQEAAARADCGHRRGRGISDPQDCRLDRQQRPQTGGHAAPGAASPSRGRERVEAPTSKPRRENPVPCSGISRGARGRHRRARASEKVLGQLHPGDPGSAHRSWQNRDQRRGRGSDAETELRTARPRCTCVRLPEITARPHTATGILLEAQRVVLVEKI